MTLPPLLGQPAGLPRAPAAAQLTEAGPTAKDLTTKGAPTMHVHPKVPLFLSILCSAALVLGAEKERSPSELDRACTKGDSGACLTLSQRHARGQGVEQSIAKANYFLLKACDLDSGEGCFGLGSAFLSGSGFEKDPLKAMVLFDKACRLGHADSCQNMGVIEDSGKQYALAARYYEKACAGGVAKGCFNLGSLHEAGEGVTRDAVKAREYFVKACALGHEKACRRIGK